ncbi:MAG: hypothetical protein AAF499_05815 [Pseudomonadota bacterium]
MKRLCLGLLFGFIVGMWFGINIGKDRPFYVNPLEGNTLSGSAESSS